jgi:Abortive infection alpha
MTDNALPGNDLSTELARELVRQLPIKDATLPAAKQTGEILADLTKVLHLALAPVQLLAAFQDRFRQFVNRAVRRVPEERRITPASQIVGPILEGIRYEPDGTLIDELFSELLSRSIDRERVHEAHPSYPIIIRQLSADEARILSRLRDRNFDYVHTRNYDRKKNLFMNGSIEIDDLPRVGLAYPENVQFYMAHLNQLGLAGIFQQGNQEPLFGNESGQQIGIRIRSQYRLTDFGQHFVRACTAGEAATDFP